MEDPQRIIVNEHIHDLQQDAQDLRSERQLRLHARDGDGHELAGRTDPNGARVRLGHWLIGVGLAVAGSPSERHGGAERAA